LEKCFFLLLLSFIIFVFAFAFVVLVFVVLVFFTELFVFVGSDETNVLA